MTGRTRMQQEEGRWERRNKQDRHWRKRVPTLKLADRGKGGKALLDGGAKKKNGNRGKVGKRRQKKKAKPSRYASLNSFSICHIVTPHLEYLSTHARLPRTEHA